MKRVKLTQVLMTIPVEAIGDDWDIEIEDSLYRLMQASAKAMQRVSDACNETQAQQLERSFDSLQSERGGPLQPEVLVTKQSGWKEPPASQEDPVINTAVSDREMRSSEPELTLEEFRQNPARTRSPPRPRLNSWRHKE